MANKIEKQLQLYLKTQLDRKFNFSSYTHARVGLGHTGGHLKLQSWLELQVGFAQAKDAVFSHFANDEIVSLCKSLNLNSLEVKSQVNDVREFLLRPDFGKKLASESQTMLGTFLKEHSENLQRDLLIVISGGLSPIAIQHQIPLFLPLFIDQVRQHEWSIAPIIFNQRGRVALGDELNDYFKAKIVIMLIGERPGLSTPDSMGIYFTYNAKPGCTDEQRNCISNIHERGLLAEDAVVKLTSLLEQAFTLRLSGLKLQASFMTRRHR